MAFKQLIINYMDISLRKIAKGIYQESQLDEKEKHMKSKTI